MAFASSIAIPMEKFTVGASLDRSAKFHEERLDSESVSVDDSESDCGRTWTIFLLPELDCPGPGHPGGGGGGGS